MIRNFPKFSSRMERLPIYLLGEISEKVAKERRRGREIIDLCMGNPIDPTPRPIVEAMCRAVKDPKNHRYSTTRGILSLRRAIAGRYMKRWGVDLDPEEEVACVMGIKEGIAHLLLALLGPGDSALVPSPAYPIHTYGVILTGASLTTIPLFPIPNLFERLTETITRMVPPPKVLILNFPHNPTTATVTMDFFQKVVHIARENDMIIIHDFAYGDIVFDESVAPSLLQCRGVKDVGVEFFSMSKSFNMPGWRVGFCAGNREIINALVRIKSWYDYGIFQAVQVSAIYGLENCDDHYIHQSKIYRKRRDILYEGLKKLGWKVELPKATLYLWAPIPEEFKWMGSLTFAMRLLEEAGVAVFPGSGFGEGGENYVRFALVEKEERIEEAVSRIEGWMMRGKGTKLHK